MSDEKEPDAFSYHLSLITYHSASFFQLDRLLDEIEAARAAHLSEVAAINREEATLRRPVFVDSAGGRAVAVLLEEWTLEKYLAARAAAIAVAAPEGERLDDLIAAKAYAYEAAEFALRLPRAKLRIFDGADALGRKPLFERAAQRCATGWR